MAEFISTNTNSWSRIGKGGPRKIISCPFVVGLRPRPMCHFNLPSARRS